MNFLITAYLHVYKSNSSILNNNVLGTVGEHVLETNYCFAV